MLISFGDIVDIWYRLRGRSGSVRLFERLMMSSKERTQTWWGSAGHAPRNWWDVPDVVARWNRMITGSADTTYIQYVHDTCFRGVATVRVLSPGCGEGEKECRIAAQYPHWQITAIDMSEKRVAVAQQKAQERGCTNVSFMQRDIDEALFDAGMFDVVVFDSSLHHFSEFDVLFETLSSALAPDGVVVVNEYVGPDRFQWTRRQLDEANRQLRMIPGRLRTRFALQAEKRTIYRPGYLRMLLSDPSEAVQSSRIVPALHRNFTMVKEVPLGGNLLHLVLKDIAHHFVVADPERQEILSRLYAAEDALCTQESSDFLFGIYKTIWTESRNNL